MKQSEPRPLPARDTPRLRERGLGAVRTADDRRARRRQDPLPGFEVRSGAAQASRPKQLRERRVRRDQALAADRPGAAVAASLSSCCDRESGWVIIEPGEEAVEVGAGEGPLERARDLSLDYAASSRTSPSWRATSGFSATKRRLRASRSSRGIEATSRGSSGTVTFSTVSFGRPWTREIQASAAR